ncbi:glutaredoxin family protein [bacterium]|nr:glutaredoxin family protein [bacterium]
MFDLFILDTCPYCQKVMKFMDENGIKYNKINTKIDENALKLLAIGGKDQVPFIYDKQNHIKLYESDEIINYLKENKNV